MKTAWRQVRIPVELAERFRAMGEAMLAAHAAGRATLPNEYVEAVPLHFVMETALNEMESHNARSRNPKRRTVNDLTSATYGKGG